MDEAASLIKAKAETILGEKVYNLERFENVPNNAVYGFVTGSGRYIFKVYRSGDWPENGKPAFVEQKLAEAGIPHARLIAFDRSDTDFPSGFLIEEFVAGDCADRLAFSASEAVKLYTELAYLVSRVHRIRLDGYGYIGDGSPKHPSFSSCIAEIFDERIAPLCEQRLLDLSFAEDLKKLLIHRLEAFDDLPAVLCHGDLSIKNIIVRDLRQLVLIDWDDAMAYNWMADIVRLTHWMKQAYPAGRYAEYKQVFLSSYATEHGDAEAFLAFEKAFNLFIMTDHLAYYRSIRDYRAYHDEFVALVEAAESL